MTEVKLEGPVIKSNRDKGDVGNRRTQEKYNNAR